MTIKRKVEKDFDKVIEKGGHVTADLGDKDQWTNFCLRIKSDMLKDIEVAIGDLPGLSKTGFILQAIHEKMKKMAER